MLADYLKIYARYDVTAAPGHGYRQIDHFLGQGRRGTPEHFATAYALLARTLDLPSRVVVGFEGGRRVGDAVQVRSGDVMVWPEIKFDRLGWIRFNPLPDGARPSKNNGGVAAGQTEQKLEQAQKSAASQQRDPGPTKTTQEQQKPAPAEESPTPWWVFASTAVGALAIGYLCAVLLAPALRKRRRRTGTPPLASPAPGTKRSTTWRISACRRLRRSRHTRSHTSARPPSAKPPTTTCARSPTWSTTPASPRPTPTRTPPTRPGSTPTS